MLFSFPKPARKPLRPPACPPLSIAIGTRLTVSLRSTKVVKSLVENGKVKYFGVATAEKLPRGATLEATGSSGHGSVPRVDNAVVHLAAAVAKAGTWDTPARLNETTRVFFERLATISPPEEAAWYSNVLDPKVQEELKHKKPQYYSMVRTSVVPTMLESRYKSNVIPPHGGSDARHARPPRRRPRPSFARCWRRSSTTRR